MTTLSGDLEGRDPGWDEALAAAHREDDEQYASGTGKGAGPEEILPVVYPIIATAVRAQIAADIEQRILDCGFQRYYDSYGEGRLDGMELATLIAAGET